MTTHSRCRAKGQKSGGQAVEEVGTGSHIGTSAPGGRVLALALLVSSILCIIFNPPRLWQVDLAILVAPSLSRIGA